MEVSRFLLKLRKRKMKWIDSLFERLNCARLSNLERRGALFLEYCSVYRHRGIPRSRVLLPLTQDLSNGKEEKKKEGEKKTAIEK